LTAFIPTTLPSTVDRGVRESSQAESYSWTVDDPGTARLARCGEA
jgi:hypothetical protein